MLILINKETNEKIKIEEITFVIGRGSILQVTEKKVSRNHGVINVLDSDGVINVKSTHPNPIFYKLQANVGQLKILQQDQDVTLSTGDLFGLLEKELWYEIATEDGPQVGQNVNTINAGDQCTEKNDPSIAKSRYLEPASDTDVSLQSTDETTQSKVETTQSTAESTEPAIEETQSQVDTPPVTAPAAIVPTRRIPAWMVTQREAESSSKRSVDAAGVEQEAPKRIKVEVPSSPSTSGVTNTCSVSSPAVVVKTEPRDTQPKTAAADSSTRRPSCNFGVRCYRKRNPIHAAAEAHPGDSDYRRPDLPPAPDGAPACPYGASCYRRNPRHFIECSHPDSTNLQQQILNNKRRRTAVSYTVHVDYGDISDDDEDFQASDDEDVYDPNKTEPEDSDEDDTPPCDGEGVV